MIVTMSLIASLLTSLMLVPMLCSKFLTGEEAARHPGLDSSIAGARRSGLDRGCVLPVSRLVAAQPPDSARLLRADLSMVPGSDRVRRAEFFPQEDQNQLQAAFELPVGTRYERAGLVGLQMAKIAEAHMPESQYVYARWGVVDEAGAQELIGDMETYNGLLFIKLVDKEKRRASPKEIIERVRPVTDRIPGAVIRYDVRDPFEEMIFGTGGALSIELYGNDLVEAAEYAEQVKRVMSGINGIEDVTISRKEEKPESR